MRAAGRQRADLPVLRDSDELRIEDACRRVIRRLENHGRSPVAHRVSRKTADELLVILQLPAHAVRRLLAAGDEHAPVLTARNEGLGHLHGVEHRVAGVLHIHHRAGETKFRGDDVACRGLDEILASAREDQQVGLARRLVERDACCGDGEVGGVPSLGPQMNRLHPGQAVDEPGRDLEFRIRGSEVALGLRGGSRRLRAGRRRARRFGRKRNAPSEPIR